MALPGPGRASSVVATDRSSTHLGLERDHNVDLIRAIAISMVLFLHLFQAWPTSLPRIDAVSWYGRYGVDLFFMLSGWLIGGLLWRELERYQNVQIPRFIGRRALRTMPPYFVAMTIAYLGVRVVRHERFDFGYLFFIQNYYSRIPYFLISWSLCIEEQFYLVVPAAAVLAIRSRARVHLFFLLAVLTPTVLRFYYWTPGGDGLNADATHHFGRYFTATPLRCEGLLLGVWASLIHQQSAVCWSRLQRMAPYAAIVVLLGLVLVFRSNDRVRYVFVFSGVALLSACILVASVGKRPLPFAASKPVYWVACTSYSIYLIHQFVLDAGFRIVRNIPTHPVVQFSTIIGLIVLAGGTFYFVIELPSLALRKKLIPSRTGAPSVLLDPLNSDPIRAGARSVEESLASGDGSTPNP